MRWCAAVAVAVAVSCVVTPDAGAKPPIRVSPFAQGHAYRHGAVPQRGHKAATTTATSTNNLTYGGGISGVGVTTGSPKVYLVFWGSQWGSQATNSAGNLTLSVDTKRMATYVEACMKGVGTNGETWSGVMTQYCEGVASGSQTCPSTAAHVGYPSDGAF